MSELVIIPLASSSKGNAHLVTDGETTVLVDAGITADELFVRAADAGFSLAETKVSAVLITHEHCDHIKDAGRISTLLNAPVYAHSSVFSYIKHKCGKISNLLPLERFEAGFSCGSLWIRAFRVPHDAAYTVGYRFSNGVSSAALATDFGEMTENIFNNLSGADTVLLECNHDEDMLISGRYPFILKKRIQGRHGHLSNRVAAETAARLAATGVKKIILGHLSEENNTPETAFAAVSARLFEAGVIEGTDIEISIARK